MFWILAYLVFGLVMSAKISKHGVSQILRYNQGEAISIRGSSPAQAKERARKFCTTLNTLKDADAEKFAHFLVTGFIFSVVTWPCYVYIRLMYSSTARIQNGVVLD